MDGLYALADHHRRLQELHGQGPGRPWPPTGYIFGTRWGTPLEPRNLTRLFGKLCDDHGIRRVPLHGLRHTCVSLLLALGTHPRVVMKIVGRSAIEMTMNKCGAVATEAAADPPRLGRAAGRARATAP